MWVVTIEDSDKNCYLLSDDQGRLITYTSLQETVVDFHKLSENSSTYCLVSMCLSPKALSFTANENIKEYLTKAPFTLVAIYLHKVICFGLLMSSQGKRVRNNSGYSV